MKELVLFLIMSLTGPLLAAETESIKIQTPRAEEISAVVHYPEGNGPHPAVIIGSGQGYHMGLPLTKGLAESLAKSGFVALRFDWAYYPKGERPSEGLVNEIEDYQSALGYLINHPRVKKEQIIAAGKSLGTGVAYNVFQKTTLLKGLILMTPICSWNWDDEGSELSAPIPVAEENYPDLKRDSRPIVMALGTNDPYCSTPLLFDYLKDSSGNISTLIFGGDHSFNLGPFDDPAFEERNQKNIDAAVHAITQWADLILGR